jgi:hypothetical protein
MPIADRVALFKKMGAAEANGKTHFENAYAGKRMTIQYDELSKDGVPLRIVTDGIVLRDYE